MSSTCRSVVRHWIVVAALLGSLAASPPGRLSAAPLPAQQIRQITIVQDMVIGLAPGQRGRLTVSPDVYPEFDPQAVVLNVLGEDGQLLVTTGRQPIDRGAPRFFAVEFAHSGSGRRLVRFQYQLAGERIRGSSARPRETTTPLAPGTLEIVDPGAETARLLVPIPALRTDGTAASCALPAPSTGVPLRANRGRDDRAREIAVGEFPLVRLTDRQAIQFTLVDSVPSFVHQRAELGVMLRVLGPTGDLLLEQPESPLDGRSLNHWVFGTELPRSTAAVAAFVLQYFVTCKGECDTLAGWLARAQPSGPPLTPGLQVVDDASGGTAIAMLVPAVQKVRDAASRGDGGGSPTPPPPPPNT